MVVATRGLHAPATPPGVLHHGVLAVHQVLRLPGPAWVSLVQVLHGRDAELEVVDVLRGQDQPRGDVQLDLHQRHRPRELALEVVHAGLAVGNRELERRRVAHRHRLAVQ